MPCFSTGYVIFVDLRGCNDLFSRPHFLLISYFQPGERMPEKKSLRKGIDRPVYVSRVIDMLIGIYVVIPDSIFG